MEYSSNAKGNLGVTLGAIGTGLSVLSGGASMLTGITPATNKYVTKDEADLMHSISQKDSEIALLKADQASEVKMTQVYQQAHSEIAQLRDNTNSSIKELQNEINQNRMAQDAWNASQSVINAQMSSAIATNTNSISALQNTMNEITQVKIPNSAVCPGWGNYVVQPVMCNGGTTLG